MLVFHVRLNNLLVRNCGYYGILDWENISDFYLIPFHVYNSVLKDV